MNHLPWSSQHSNNFFFSWFCYPAISMNCIQIGFVRNEITSLNWTLKMVLICLSVQSENEKNRLCVLYSKSPSSVYVLITNYWNQTIELITRISSKKSIIAYFGVEKLRKTYKIHFKWMNRTHTERIHFHKFKIGKIKPGPFGVMQAISLQDCKTTELTRIAGCAFYTFARQHKPSAYCVVKWYVNTTPSHHFDCAIFN